MACSREELNLLRYQRMKKIDGDEMPLHYRFISIPPCLMMEWSLQEKINEMNFNNLTVKCIKETLQRYHSSISSTLTQLQLDELVKLIQEDRIGRIISTISRYRQEGKIVSEENLLSYIGNYVKIGVEFFYPMFRELVRIDPNGERIHLIDRFDEIRNFILSHNL